MEKVGRTKENTQDRKDISAGVFNRRTHRVEKNLTPGSEIELVVDAGEEEENTGDGYGASAACGSQQTRWFPLV